MSLLPVVIVGAVGADMTLNRTIIRNNPTAKRITLAIYCTNTFIFSFIFMSPSPIGVNYIHSYLIKN